MYELLVMLPFLVQSDAAEADLAGIPIETEISS